MSDLGLIKEMINLTGLNPSNISRDDVRNIKMMFDLDLTDPETTDDMKHYLQLQLDAWEKMTGPSVSEYFNMEDIQFINEIVWNRTDFTKEQKLDIFRNRFCPRGLIFHSDGLNRFVFKTPGYGHCVKIPFLAKGFDDARAENINQYVIRPNVTKIFDYAAGGSVSISELVSEIVTPQMLYERRFEMTTVLLNLERHHTMADVGSNALKNWGIRMSTNPYLNDTLVLLDFPYIYKVINGKLKCPDCGGRVVIDGGFNNYYCKKCGHYHDASIFGPLLTMEDVLYTNFKNKEEEKRKMSMPERFSFTIVEAGTGTEVLRHEDNTPTVTDGVDTSFVPTKVELPKKGNIDMKNMTRTGRVVQGHPAMSFTITEMGGGVVTSGEVEEVPDEYIPPRTNNEYLKREFGEETVARPKKEYARQKPVSEGNWKDHGNRRDKNKNRNKPIDNRFKHQEVPAVAEPKKRRDWAADVETKDPDEIIVVDENSDIEGPVRHEDGEPYSVDELDNMETETEDDYIEPSDDSDDYDDGYDDEDELNSDSYTDEDDVEEEDTKEKYDLPKIESSDMDGVIF